MITTNQAEKYKLKENIRIMKGKRGDIERDKLIKDGKKMSIGEIIT